MRIGLSPTSREPLPQSPALPSPAASDMGGDSRHGHEPVRRASAALTPEAVLDAYAALGLSRPYLQFALAHARRHHEPFAAVLRDFGLATGEQIARALAAAHGCEYADVRCLADLDVPALRHPEVRARATAQMVPIGLDRRTGSVRVAIAEEGVLVGTVVDLATQWRPLLAQPVVVSSETLTALWQRLYADTDEAVQAAADTDADEPEFARRIMEALLRHACARGASDLHFTPTARGGYVRLRIDGQLAPYLSFSKLAIERLVGLLANEGSVRDLIDTSEALFPPPADLAGRYGFRVQLTQTVNGTAAVVRVLDRQSPVVEFDSLGFDAEAARTIRRWATAAEGMIVVTGPTGSGKTTTLFAVMRLIDGMRCAVLTVENPVELRCPQWHQSQVQPVAGVTEAEAFRRFAKGFLRSDPDVCLVGELRDAATINAAIDLASTGHLVFATVHANGAPQTLQRLAQLGVPGEAISAVLTGVLAQRLVPRLCPQCSAPATDADTLEALREYPDARPRRAVGCPSCDDTGYRGRLLVYELLRVDPEARELIARGASHVELAGRIEKRARLWGRGLALVARGDTTLAALREHVEEA